MRRVLLFVLILASACEAQWVPRPRNWGLLFERGTPNLMVDSTLFDARIDTLFDTLIFSETDTIVNNTFSTLKEIQYIVVNPYKLVDTNYVVWTNKSNRWGITGIDTLHLLGLDAWTSIDSFNCTFYEYEPDHTSRSLIIAPQIDFYTNGELTDFCDNAIAPGNIIVFHPDVTDTATYVTFAFRGTYTDTVLSYGCVTIEGTDDIKDATIRLGGAGGCGTVGSQNWGGYSQLRVSPGATQDCESLLRASYGGVDSGSTITSAILYLYCESAPASSANAIDVGIWRLIKDWREGTASVARQDSMVTWCCRGWGIGENGTNIAIADSAWHGNGLDEDFDYDTPLDTVTIDSAAVGWYAFDVTDIVQNQVTYPDSNCGFFFKTITGGDINSAFFTSTEGASNQPYLEVQFTRP